MKRVCILLISYFISINSFASNYINSGFTTIKYITVFGPRTSAPGDIKILLNNTVAGCADGYYLLESSVGLKEILSVALSAYHTQSKVRVNAYKGEPWRGSLTRELCKIESIRIGE